MPQPGRTVESGTFQPAWSLNRRAIYLVFLVLFGLALSSTWKVSMEDAYITYTYARNLADGEGFVFNEGEDVLGTTTPLYTLLLAALGRVIGSGRIVEVSCVLSCLGLLMQAALFYELFRKHALAGIGALIGIGILLNLTEAYWYTGMETNLLGGGFVLLLWILFGVNRPVWGGVVAGIIVLFRYDGGTFVATAYTVWTLAGGRSDITNRVISTATAAVVACLVTFPWVLWAWNRFGSPMPTAWSVKQGVFAPQVYAAFQLARLGQFVDTYARPHSSLFLAIRFFRHVVSIPGIILVWAFAIAGWIQLSPRGRWFHFFAVFPLVFIAILAFLGPPITHAWHTYPAQLCFFVLISAGAYSAWVWLRSLVESHPPGAGSSIFRGVTWLVPAGFAASLLWFAAGFQKRVAVEMWYGPREATYGRIAEHLNRHAVAGDSVLHTEVGYLAYHTDCRMIDRTGLLTPDLVSPVPGGFEDLGATVARLRPNYVVVQDHESGSMQRFPEYERILDAGETGLYRRK